MSSLSKWMRNAERAVSNLIPHQHSADRRAANEAVAEQIDYYRKQKDELAKESKRVEDERNMQKQRLAEKQIKSARRAYRPPGFMEDVKTAGYSDTLG